MKVATRIFSLVFILLAKSVLAFAGDNSGISYSSAESIGTMEHMAISSGDFLAADENDLRSAEEDDNDQDDFAGSVSSLSLRFMRDHLFFKTAFFYSHPRRDGQLFLLYRNFRK